MIANSAILQSQEFKETNKYEVKRIVGSQNPTSMTSDSPSKEYSKEFDLLLSNKIELEKFAILQDTIDKSNDNDKIIFAAEAFYEIALNSKNNTMISKGLLNLGSSYWFVSNYIKSIRYLAHSRNFAKTINDTLTIINSDIYFALVYGRLKDWTNVEKYLSEALELSKLINSDFEMASSLWNFAFLNINKQNYNDAINNCDESYFHLSKVKNQSDYLMKFGLGLIYYYKGIAYPFIKQYDSATVYLHKSLEINTDINNEYLIAACQSEIAWAMFHKSNYDSAIYYSQKCIDYSKGRTNFEHIAGSYQTLFNTYEKLGNLPLAYQNYKKFKEMNDSIYKNDARVAASKHELESAMNDFEIERKSKETQKNFIIIIAIIIVSTLIIITILLYSRYKLKSKIGIQLAEINATKDKFFTIISHDLKTPIASFNNLTSLLNEYFDNLSDEDKLLQISLLKESSANILKLLDNLLIWSRIQTGKINHNPDIIDLNELITSEIELIKPIASSKNIDIQYRSTNNYYGFADIDMMSIILRNLLSNAIKFTNINGTIQIATSDANDFICISVIDDGIGIDDKDLQKLFKIDIKHSTRGTNNEKGTGLGLNLCKEFIEMNGGKIWVESKQNEGTIVKFTVLKNN